MDNIGIFDFTLFGSSIKSLVDLAIFIYDSTLVAFANYKLVSTHMLEKKILLKHG